MASVGLDEMLYYQYMINHNSASTMLNAISGTSSLDDGMLGMGSIGGLGQVDTSGSFYQILQQYLGNSTQGTDSINALETAGMVDKLQEALGEAREAGETETKSYQTVQEIYEFFADQVAGKANLLLGGTSASMADRSGAASQQASDVTAETDISKMNQIALRGGEYDFNEIDTLMDAAFSERIPSIS